MTDVSLTEKMKFPNDYGILNFPFLKKNRKNGNKGELPDFNEFSLYMNFVIFPQMTISILALFVKLFS